MISMILAVMLGGTTPANVPSCTEARDRMARAHKQAGHIPVGADLIPNGAIFQWVDAAQTTIYADVFLQADKSTLVSDTFEQKGVCKGSGDTDVNFYQGQLPLK
jgi:hypothetical protein